MTETIYFQPAPCAEDVGRLLHGGVGRLEVLQYAIPGCNIFFLWLQYAIPGCNMSSLGLQYALSAVVICPPWL